MLRSMIPFVALVTLLMACTPATVQDSPQRTSDPAVVGDSRLSESDPQLDSGEYYETLSYAGQAGQFVTISLSSDEFDPYLIVLDPEGEKIAEIDDSVGYGYNILVSLNLTATGSYTLVVTSFEPGETGRFTLDVRSDPDGEPLTPIWESAGAA